MNKMLKISLVVVLLLAVALVAQSGAWASKVAEADQAPAADLSAEGVAASRLVGTSSGSSARINQVHAGGGVAAVKQTSSVPGGKSGRPDGTWYKATGTQGTLVEITFAVGPNWSGDVYFWDGSAWVNTGSGIDNGNGTRTVTLPGGIDPLYFIITPTN